MIDYRIRFNNGNEIILSSKNGLSEIINYFESYFEMKIDGKDIKSFNDIESIERIY